MKKIFSVFMITAVLFSTACKSKDKKEPGDDDMDDMTKTETSASEPIAMNAKGGYGVEITTENALDVKQFASNPAMAENYKGKISGVVSERCKAMGCWVTLDMGNGESVMVQFRDASGGEFFVPQELIGKKLVVSGAMEASTLTVDEQKHLAEDAGKSTADISAEKKQLVFEADGAIAL